MKTPIAIYNLWHQGAKTLVSIGGVAFALLLVFMQLGFMGAVSDTATNVLEKLEFDVLIRSRDYLHLYESGNVDRRWLTIAENTDGVHRALPFWIMIQNWRKLANESELSAQPIASGAGDVELQDFETQYLPIAVMAYRPDDQPFNMADVQEHTEDLHRADLFLLDDSTKSDYGPWNGKAFTQADIELSSGQDLADRRPEIGGKEFEIAALFKLGTGLAANGAAIMGERAFSRISPWDTTTTTSLGLVQLEDSDPLLVDQVVRDLRERVGAEVSGDVGDAQLSILERARRWFGGVSPQQSGGSVEVLSRQDAFEREKYRWLWQTPIGLIFQMGVVISLLVGAAIVYMVLSTDVANRLPEYATLLAMGYSRTYLAGIVMTQAIVLCALGFLSAWGVAEVLYRVTSSFSGIPLTMDAFKIVLVGVLGLLMCCVSGLLALRKLWKAEPASLF